MGPPTLQLLIRKLIIIVGGLSHLPSAPNLGDLFRNAPVILRARRVWERAILTSKKNSMRGGTPVSYIILERQKGAPPSLHDLHWNEGVDPFKSMARANSYKIRWSFSRNSDMMEEASHIIINKSKRNVGNWIQIFVTILGVGTN